LGIKALSDAIKPHGFNIGANLGRVAGAGIEDHIHFHIVPRWNGDTNFMPVLNDVKVISEEMGRTYDKLKNSLNNLI
ncbi:MAG TPA: HIT family hydrolase, partial [Ignavibacteria bacterium]|nr:HIT family hydrolase [Ignavibacteria bacterium]